MNSAKKIPSPLVSLFPIAFLVGMLFATIHTFGSDALSGGSQISLLATTGMCVFIGMAFYRIPWKDYELAITNNISGVATAIIILLIIGALSGTWMISGVVPTLIYYGMQIIHPNFFLASTCIICALVSVMTGSSWTTIATNVSFHCLLYKHAFPLSIASFKILITVSLPARKGLIRIIRCSKVGSAFLKVPEIL